ncbi:MAG: elongation factor P, partial [Lentisphaeria bacterium]|nr:elongation factor P [Lentisphaeria bacterium]
LIENSLCNFVIYNDEPIEITLPTFIEKEIVETEPGVRGDTATNVTKPAKIDTRTGAYAERVSKA